MHRLLKLRTFFILLTVKLLTVFGDPCTSHQELGTADDHTRSVANSDLSSSICDAQLTEGWYRITSKAGERMPTECIVGGFRCGASEPMWMNGSFPDTGVVHNVTAHVSDFTGNCIKESFDIQVKNCSSYLVYYLKPVTTCSQRYCFGSELACPSGTSSVNGFTPGCKFDPCLSVNHKELDEWKRSTGYSNTSGLCDNFLKSGWYRPVSLVGNAMPTECQQNGFKCGTSNPIWMNGAHPAVGETANVTACVAGYNGGCCNNAYNIQVKNCADFYVYNLIPTLGCYQAYCFGNESKCPVGQTSDNGGFTPGCEFDPCHESNYDVLRGEVKRSSNYTLGGVGSVAIEDSRLASNWYRIDSETGNDIVNTSVEMMHCGTVSPVWMQGNIPTVEEKTVNRKVCRSGIKNYTVGDCVEQYDIQVRNCGSYRTYYLQQLNVDKAAYCFGTLPVPPPTTTTTTTTTTTRPLRPHDSKEDKEKNGDGHVRITTAIIIISILCVILMIVLGIMCYKKKMTPKRAVSFVEIERVSSPPPAYEELTKQNKDNYITEQQGKVVLDNQADLHEYMSIPPVYTVMK